VYFEVWPCAREAGGGDRKFLIPLILRLDDPNPLFNTKLVNSYQLLGSIRMRRYWATQPNLTCQKGIGFPIALVALREANNTGVGAG
jgi:hypothetical protein